jgi:glycosyltransferase involved in cell wall biosynthesis
MRVLFVTNHVPFDRVGAFAALAERVELDLVTFGGSLQHGASPVEGHGRPVAEREVRALAAGGEHDAVVCGTGGRVALPGAYAGARQAGTPFVLWASLWAHPRTLAHAFSYLPLLRIYRGADAVVTYGEHVSAYVRARGARRVHIAPQAVDNAFWAQPSGELAEEFTALFVGRDEPGKGLRVLRDAWDGEGRLEILTGGATPDEVRNFYARASVLVVPSVRTRAFREPWGLAINEAMNQRTAIIASDEVGAVAGGLVRHERNGLVFPAGDVRALATAIARLRSDRALRDRLADNGTRDVAAFSHEAWAAGFEAALREATDC